MRSKYALSSLAGNMESRAPLRWVPTWAFCRFVQDAAWQVLARMIDPDTRDIVMNEYLSEVVIADAGGDGRSRAVGARIEAGLTMNVAACFHKHHVEGSTAEHANMLILTKKRAIVIAATLGIALHATWMVPAVAAEKKSHVTPLKKGDLVRPRMGGPLMIVDSVQDGQVTTSWWSQEGPWSEGRGRFASGTFPVGALLGPITIPPARAEGPNTLPRSVYEWPGDRR